ncbi:MAG: AAA family ATPase [Gemmatimonadaceae bacterium]
MESYRGEFFPGFASPGSGEFERWIDLERARCRAVFVRCAESVVRQWLSHGRARDAASLARRVRDIDPVHPTGWRLLLESLIAARDTLTAVVEGDALERVIAEHGLDPEPSLRKLLALVRRKHSAPESSRPTSPLARLEMIGREREFAALMRAWDHALQGIPTCVLVTAPAGFGKTRLLREFEARLESLRARYVSLRCSRASRDIALSVASDLVARVAMLPGSRAVSTETARILVGISPSLASQFDNVSAARVSLEPVAVRNALVELLEAVSYEKPVALLVDDLHWSDEESRQIIAGAFDALERRTALLVASDRHSRSGFGSTTLPLPLEPLSRAAIDTLIGSVATVPNEPWVAALASDLQRYTGGSPLSILETLQLALERGTLDLADGAWRLRDPDELTALLTAGSAVRERVGRLPSRQQEIIRALAIADHGLDRATLSRACEHHAATLERSLEQLELDGFVERIGTRCMLAHHEFGAAATFGMDDAAVGALERVIGRALAHERADSSELRLAASHMRAADDWSALGTVLQRFVREGVPGGRWRPAREVAGELLGQSVRSKDVDRLLRSLPLLMRAGIVTSRQRAFAGVAALAMAAALAGALVWRDMPNEPRLLASVTELQPNGETWLWEIPVAAVRRNRNWSPGQLLIGAELRTVLRGSISDVVPLHGRHARWVIERTSSDSGEMDLYLREENGFERRLTAAPGDDIHPDPSPDGRSIAFATASTHPLQHTDIAVLDLSDLRRKMITSGDESDRMPKWSPSGTRIAFLRQYWDTRPMAFCLTSRDAPSPVCFPAQSDGIEPTELRWFDEDQIEISATGRGHRVSRRFNVSTRMWATEWRPSDASDIERYSPDGQWSLCLCAARDAPAVVPSVHLRRRTAASSFTSVDHHTSGRVLRIVGFRSEHEPRTYLARLSSVGDSAFALIGVPFKVGVGSIDAAGRAVPISTLVFDSSDSSVATIDSSGLANPIREGVSTIGISAGGWRRTSLRLRVVPNDTTTLLREDWCKGLGEQWKGFGSPAPTTRPADADQCSFANSGDGRFLSGAYTRASFSPLAGLFVVAQLSTPVRLSQWQEQTIGLRSDYDTSRLGRWDHVTGYPWQEGRLSSFGAPQCELRFPGGSEGPQYARLIWAAGRTFALPDTMLQRMTSGAWYEVTLQLFPDGRCGAAIDGTPIALGEPARLPLRPFILMLHGSSHDTRILVGALRVSRGVRSDIDWRILLAK